jgi:AcrR family transcriptional regulator
METPSLDPSVSDGLRPRDRQREATRKRLFEAAMTVFRRDGVSNARIDDIVELAHVSRGSFYFHFPTKEDVLAELMRESGVRVAAIIDTVPAHAPMKDVLEAVSVALAAEWENDLRIFPEIAMVALRIVASVPLSENQSLLRSRLTDRFAEAIERGQLTKAVHASVLVDVFLINQFTAAIAWSGRPKWPLATALKGMSTLFLHGAHRDG